MRAGIRISSLVPSGLVIESVSDSSDSIILAVRSEDGVPSARCAGRDHAESIADTTDRSRICPLQASKYASARSRGGLFARDLIVGGRFSLERFGDDVLPTWSRRTARLESIVHHLGLALGGRPAASFAKRLMLPVSNDTLLRVVRRRTASRADPLIVVGVDDWAFRRNRRYGTIVTISSGDES